jgi:hypothetical protein
MISSHVEKLSIFHIFNPFSDLLRRVKIDSFPTRGRNIPPNAPHAPLIYPLGVYKRPKPRAGDNWFSWSSFSQYPLGLSQPK